MIAETIPQITETVPQITEALAQIEETIPETTEIIPQVTEAVLQMSDAFANIPLREFVDYSLIIIPILLSLVAIWISISTARKQNKISMFELRYQCLSQIRSIITFSDTLHDCDEPVIIWSMFDSFWGTDISDKGFDERLIKAKCKMESIKKDVLQAKYLFKKQPKTDLELLIEKFQRFVSGSMLDNTFLEVRDELHKLCLDFKEKDYPILAQEAKP